MPCRAVPCCASQAQVAATEKMLTAEKAKSATLQKQSSELTAQLSGMSVAVFSRFLDLQGLGSLMKVSAVMR